MGYLVDAVIFFRNWGKHNHRPGQGPGLLPFLVHSVALISPPIKNSLVLWMSVYLVEPFLLSTIFFRICGLSQMDSLESSSAIQGYPWKETYRGLALLIWKQSQWYQKVFVFDVYYRYRYKWCFAQYIRSYSQWAPHSNPDRVLSWDLFLSGLFHQIPAWLTPPYHKIFLIMLRALGDYNFLNSISHANSWEKEGINIR